MPWEGPRITSCGNTIWTYDLPHKWTAVVADNTATAGPEGHQQPYAVGAYSEQSEVAGGRYDTFAEAKTEALNLAMQQQHADEYQPL